VVGLSLSDDLSSMGGPASSYATAGIALRVVGVLKPPHHDKVETPRGGCCHSVQNILSSSFLSKNVKIKTYRTINLPVVLYGFETLSLTLREERKLRLFENKVLRRIFGSKKEEVTGEWRKLHNETLNDLYSSPNIFQVIKLRRMSWAGHVARMGERRGVFSVLVGKPDGKRQL